MSENEYDYLIIGAGIIGLTLAYQIKNLRPNASVCVIDKEEDVARHASGRNSGVLHAGFYYTANSLKARFCVEGNRAMRSFCETHHIPINTCGKLVVAQNENELASLYELEKRGQVNGSTIRLIDEAEAKDYEPCVRTYQKALWSPNTASVDPQQVCQKILSLAQAQGVQFQFKTSYRSKISNGIETTSGTFFAKKIINSAGLYADKIAHEFGFGKPFTIIPFKGLYLKYTKNKTDITRNIYPVPNLKNPFLGVHYTKTVDGTIKIGPTAIPAFWREHYQGFNHFRLSECLQIMSEEMKLFVSNSFGFRDLAREEMKKYNKRYMVSLAEAMAEGIDPDGFTEFTKPGIRAQLLNTTNGQLVQDFLIESDEQSLHILNAVSPGFTCAFPFTQYICREYLELS